jgi:hypothetical protein
VITDVALVGCPSGGSSSPADQATHGDDRVSEVEERVDDGFASFVAALQPVEAGGGGNATASRPPQPDGSFAIAGCRLGAVLSPASMLKL